MATIQKSPVYQTPSRNKDVKKKITPDLPQILGLICQSHMLHAYIFKLLFFFSVITKVGQSCFVCCGHLSLSCLDDRFSCTFCRVQSLWCSGSGSVFSLFCYTQTHRVCELKKKKEVTSQKMSQNVHLTQKRNDKL